MGIRERNGGGGTNVSGPHNSAKLVTLCTTTDTTTTIAATVDNVTPPVPGVAAH